VVQGDPGEQLVELLRGFGGGGFGGGLAHGVLLGVGCCACSNALFKR
jgi:hypothetical protein